MMLQYIKEFCDLQVEKVQDQKARDWFGNLKKAVKKQENIMENEITLYPVEYRPLHHKGKNTVQGMLELFVEIFESQAAKLIPISKIAKPTPEEYELRLILWKCEDIPKENETIDIYFRAHFDPTG